MSKLHELLAVENNLEQQSSVALNDLTNTFEKKRHLFGSKRVTFTPLEEGQPSKTEEQSDIQTSVIKELNWIGKIISKSIDIGYQIDVANTTAKADVVTEDGEVLLKDVPSTALLQLEKDVKRIQDLIKNVPTLDPAKGFKYNKDVGCYEAREVTATRTRKEKKVLVAYAATVQHPAQCQVYDADVPVGTITTQEWSSLITPSNKAEMLDKCDILIRAIKKARSKANEVDIDVSQYKVGQKLFDFITKVSGQ